jgi:hypothetical protein
LDACQVPKTEAPTAEVGEVPAPEELVVANEAAPSGGDFSGDFSLGAATAASTPPGAVAAVPTLPGGAAAVSPPGERGGAAARRREGPPQIAHGARVRYVRGGSFSGELGTVVDSVCGFWVLSMDCRPDAPVCRQALSLSHSATFTYGGGHFH